MDMVRIVCSFYHRTICITLTLICRCDTELETRRTELSDLAMQVLDFCSDSTQDPRELSDLSDLLKQYDLIKAQQREINRRHRTADGERQMSQSAEVSLSEWSYPPPSDNVNGGVMVETGLAKEALPPKHKDIMTHSIFAPEISLQPMRSLRKPMQRPALPKLATTAHDRVLSWGSNGGKFSDSGIEVTQHKLGHREVTESSSDGYSSDQESDPANVIFNPIAL